MIFDTDVLIWTLRGNTRAARAIQRESERAMTVVNHMELMQGARDRRELALIKSFIKDLGFRVLPLSQRIGHRAAILMEEHTRSSGLTLADAFVAATALENEEPLCTANAKHFRIVPDLRVKVFRPE
jgi:predicted nucleic acid-binding protein